jgi:acyl carrier protein phosphodiesterase
MISDFVKGKKKFDYETAVQNGIHLHRQIDTFTDSHPATKQAKLAFKPYVGLYAGAFMDVVYDHFLAADKNEFPGSSLALFADYTYKILYSYQHILPERFAAMLPYMSRQNWLYNYSTVEGTEKSFGGVVRRAAYLKNSDTAFTAFMKNYDNLRQYYQAFFPAVKKFAEDELMKVI